MNNWFVDYIDWPKETKNVRLSKTGVAGLQEDQLDHELSPELKACVEWGNKMIAQEVDAWAQTAERGQCWSCVEGDYRLNACIGQFDGNSSPFMKRPFARVLVSYKLPTADPTSPDKSAEKPE